jgi:hypothetical protein
LFCVCMKIYFFNRSLCVDEVASGGLGSNVDPKIAHYGDMTKDVELTREEFISAMKRMNIEIDKADCDELFRRLDANHSDTIDYIEWNQGLF